MGGFGLTAYGADARYPALFIPGAAMLFVPTFYNISNADSSQCELTQYFNEVSKNEDPFTSCQIEKVVVSSAALITTATVYIFPSSLLIYPAVQLTYKGYSLIADKPNSEESIETTSEENCERVEATGKCLDLDNADL